MCNINIVMRRDKKISRKLSEYMNYASFESFLSNDDGEGFIGINDKKVVYRKNKDKIKYNGSYWFLASHQRLATSGYEKHNIHPLPTKNLMLMHNGIFSSIGDQTNSDTYYYAEKFEDYYNKFDRSIKRAVRKISKEISGSYSILLYERKRNKMYYYKERSTSMYMLKDENYLVMSTKKSNLNYAKFFFDIETDIIEVKENIVYDVFSGMQHKTTFTPKVYSYGVIHYNENTGYYNWQNKEPEFEVDELQGKAVNNLFKEDKYLDENTIQKKFSDEYTMYGEEEVVKWTDIGFVTMNCYGDFLYYEWSTDKDSINNAKCIYIEEAVTERY